MGVLRLDGAFQLSRSDFLFPVANNKPKGCAQSSKAVSSHSTPKDAVLRLHLWECSGSTELSHRRGATFFSSRRTTDKRAAPKIPKLCRATALPKVPRELSSFQLESKHFGIRHQSLPNHADQTIHAQQRWASKTRPTLRHSFWLSWLTIPSDAKPNIVSFEVLPYGCRPLAPGCAMHP